MLAELVNIKHNKTEATPFYLLSEEGNITYISPFAAKLFNLQVDEVVGQNEATLFDSSLTFDLMEIDQRVLITGRPHQYQIKEFQDGNTKFLSVTKHLLPVSETESSKLICVLQIAEPPPPPQVQPRQVPLDQQFWALQTASTAVSNSLDLEHIGKTFVWEMVHLLQSSACAYYIWQSEQNQFLLQTKYDETQAITFAELLPLDMHRFLRHIIEEETIYQFNHASARRNVNEDAFLTQLNCSGVLIIPLANQGKISGMAIVCDKNMSRVYADSETAVARLFADQAASTILNAQLYVELLRTNERLSESNSDLQAFAKTAAHDLKTPVGSIVGFADLILKDYENFSQDELAQFLTIISRSGHQMRSIIDNLLLLASVRQQDIEISPVRMDEFLPDVLIRLAYLIKESDCEILMPDDWPTAYGNSHWIAEIWANYISNAIKYGGTPPIVKLGATPQEDGTIRFWVEDNGVGLSDEEQEKLFIPFSRLKQKGAVKGHGLGLSIVQRIVHKLGGTVGVDSVPSEGSQFYFTLPGNMVEK